MTIEEKNKLLELKGCALKNSIIRVPQRKVVVKQSELVNQVFQINPETGLPDNDLKIMQDERTSLTLRQAIKNQNQVIAPNAPSSFDEDVILDSVPTPNESIGEYFDRIKSDAADYVKSTKNE